MSNRQDELCPHCGKESEEYFLQLESDDDLDSLEALKDWTHPTSYQDRDGDGDYWACRNGCERWTRQKWTFTCEHCGEEIAAEMIYVEPCDGNPYVVEMIWEKGEA